MFTNFQATLVRSGRTQVDVARHLGTSKSHVSEWARGDRDVPVRHVVPLCHLLRCNPDDLVGWTDRI